MPGSVRSYKFSNMLTDIGHKISVITAYRNKSNKKKWFKTEINGYEVHWKPLEYSNYFGFNRRIINFIHFAFVSFFKINKLEADVIYASSTPLTVAIPSILISKIKNIPLVFEVRDVWPDVPIAMKILKNPITIFLSKILEKITYKCSKAIIVLSPDMKKNLLKKKIDSKKIAVIPNSSDLVDFKYNKKLANKFFDKRPWLKNKPILLYAGAHGVVNDLSYAIKLSKALLNQNSEVKILLVGEGIEKEKLIKLAKKENVFNKSIFFEEQIPKKDIIEYFSAATMIANFVIDVEMNWANSANKFFDGLAAGKPIYINHGGWMKDIISKYNCGLCMYGKNIDQAANELDKALSNKDWVKLAGASSKNVAKTIFNRQDHAEQLEKVLHLAINNKSFLTEKVTANYFE